MSEMKRTKVKVKDIKPMKDPKGGDLDLVSTADLSSGGAGALLLSQQEQLLNTVTQTGSSMTTTANRAKRKIERELDR
jgi:hypothetical protein